LEASIERARAQSPADGERAAEVYEAQLQITIEPVGKSLAQLRETV